MRMVGVPTIFAMLCKATTTEIATRLEAVIAANLGKTVAGLGDCEIEVED